jgi:hypothetical protein
MPCRSAQTVQRLPVAKSVTMGGSLEAHTSTCTTCGAVSASSPPDIRASVTHSQYSTCILPCCTSAAVCLEPASATDWLVSPFLTTEDRCIDEALETDLTPQPAAYPDAWTYRCYGALRCSTRVLVALGARL